MQDYKKVYLQSRGLSQYDFIPCEFCGAEAVDIHHINSSYRGPRVCADDGSDLIALCRECHEHFTKKATPLLRKNLLFLVAYKLFGTDYFD